VHKSLTLHTLLSFNSVMRVMTSGHLCIGLTFISVTTINVNPDAKYSSHLNTCAIIDECGYQSTSVRFVITIRYVRNLWVAALAAFNLTIKAAKEKTDKLRRSLQIGMLESLL